MKRRDVLSAIVGLPAVGILIGSKSPEESPGVVYLAFDTYQDRTPYRGLFKSPKDAEKAFLIEARDSWDEDGRRGWQRDPWPEHLDDWLTGIELSEVRLNVPDHCRIGKDGTPGGERTFCWIGGAFREARYELSAGPHGMGAMVPVIGGA